MARRQFSTDTRQPDPQREGSGAWSQAPALVIRRRPLKFPSGDLPPEAIPITSLQQQPLRPCAFETSCTSSAVSEPSASRAISGWASIRQDCPLLSVTTARLIRVSSNLLQQLSRTSSGGVVTISSDIPSDTLVSAFFPSATARQQMPDPYGSCLLYTSPSPRDRG